MSFLNEKFSYPNKLKKRVMQALRHFDEVGVCNEIWEALDQINNFDYFCFFNDEISNTPLNELDLIYDIGEEI